jgi:WD domain, G-beta repeat
MPLWKKVQPGRSSRPKSILTGHDGSAEALAIALDGTWLATVSWDGTARIWAADGKPRATLTGHKSPVTGVAIAPDGTWLATSSGDQTARIWAVDCPPAAGNGDRASDAVLPVEAATPATAEAAAPGAEKPPAPREGRRGPHWKGKRSPAQRRKRDRPERGSRRTGRADWRPRIPGIRLDGIPGSRASSWTGAV